VGLGYQARPASISWAWETVYHREEQCAALMCTSTANNPQSWPISFAAPSHRSLHLVFMSMTTASTSNFRLILDALDDYTKQTGIDLTKNAFAESLQNCDSLDSVLQLLQDRVQAFKDYRDGNHKLINWLSPVVRVLHGFSAILGEAAGLVSFRSRFALSESSYVSFRCHSNPQN
jgi:fungal STAND N-terminal Goodbye domain